MPNFNAASLQPETLARLAETALHASGSPQVWSEPKHAAGNDEQPRKRYVRTDDARRAVQGRGAELLHALGISWHNRGPTHILCPFHDDHDPSFRWDEAKGCCFCTCDISGKDIFSIVERRNGVDFDEAKLWIAEQLGLTDLIVDPSADKGVTVQELADAKKLPVDFLRAQGCRDLPKSGKYHNRAAMAIPYSDSKGRQLWARIRVKLSGKSKDRWRKGDVDKHGPAPLFGANSAHFLPQAGYALLVEGETDSLTCWYSGLPALGLPGAGNWNEDAHAHLFDGVPVVFVVIERDTGGQSVLKWLARSSIRERVRLLYMPEGVKDPSELWCRNPDKAAFTVALRACMEAAEPWSDEKHGPKKTEPSNGSSGNPVTYEQFYAYMPDHRYIFRPTGATWPASSVSARLPIVEFNDNGDPVPPNVVLDKTRPVEQMTWLPGAPEIIHNKYVREGGWEDHAGGACFNRYRAPTIEPGNPNGAQRWLDHILYIYPDDIERILDWCAHRVQFPGVKINHALVFGGPPGIGKDTILQPVKYGVGPWNFREITAPQALEPNNDFLQSVILLISEARDGGNKVNPYQFYEQTKVFIAAPTTLRINEKYIREYVIFNLCGVVITTNNRVNGLFLTPDDRRHDVMWSERRQTDSFFHETYFTDLYAWFDAEGARDVTAYLLERNLDKFNPKAAPPKTPAFWAIADANRASEQGELNDVLDALDRPPAVALGEIIDRASHLFEGLSEWLKDRANRRSIPHRLAECGYVPVRNPDASDGHWKLGKLERRGVIYAQDSLGLGSQIDEARKLVTDLRSR